MRIIPLFANSIPHQTYYISFVPLCRVTLLPVPIEVHIVDVEREDVYSVSNFMADVDFNSNKGFPMGFFSTQWLPSNDILIGAAWGITQVKIDTQSVLIKLPERTITSVSSDTLETVVVNPVSGDFVYRSVNSIDASSLEVKSSQVTVARLTDDVL